MFATQLTLFIDDLAGTIPNDVPRRNHLLRRFVDLPLHDDGGAVHFRPVGQSFVVGHVGEPDADLCLVAAVPDEAPHVDLATLLVLAGRPLGHLGVAAERQHCGLCNSSMNHVL